MRTSQQREPSVVPLFAAVGALYFAEGFPYGIVNELLPLYLRSIGVGLAEIGLVSAIGLAWSLKFLWAPFVDRFGSYRSWIRGCMLTIAAILVLIGTARLESSRLFWFLAAALCLASATQDIAIDALAIARSDDATVGPINSIRITTYRIALITAGGGLALVAENWGWRATFMIAALIGMAAIFPTFIMSEGRTKEEHPDVIAGMREWLARPGAGLVIVVALFYKLGDSALIPMVKPFWVDSGFGIGEIGTATTVIGIAFTIVGAIIGGFYITKIGLLRSLIHLGFIQMASNAAYVIAAASGGARGLMYSATVFENFAGGLGTAAFLSFLMSVCDKRNAATQFALLTALYGLSRTISGTASGFGVEALGYTTFFTVTLALGVPGLLVVYWRREALREYLANQRINELAN